jgi:REP element-mobilizing transposase RayT
VREDLEAYFGGILRDLGSPMLAAGVVDDHAHILYRQSKTLPVSKVVEEVKKGSSKWMKTVDKQYDCFYWQNGYGAFSVSASKLETVKQYVLRQEEHHRTITFQEEMRLFLKNYDVDYDERDIWG